jgi:putative DNA primase/helicase
LGEVCRFEKDDGRKDVLPLTFCTNGKRCEWRWQALPEPRPLYGLDRIVNENKVLIVEGEKCADAANRLMGPGISVMTWSGGCNAVEKIDWSPLMGREVIIWPDADEPGTKAALSIAEILKELGCRTTIAEPPVEVPQGWDLADAEAEGWTGQRIIELLKTALTPDKFRATYYQGWAEEKPACAEFGEEGQHIEPPLLFDDLNTPEIPPNLLPGWLGDYADAVALSTQTPPAMSVMLALAVVATCTAKRFEVSPTDSEYAEPLNLWTGTALPPASRKTAVITAIAEPLVEWERAETDRLAPSIKETERKRRVIERRLEKLEKDAANADEPARREALLVEIAMLEKELPAALIPPRLWTGDCTPERLQGLLVEHGERMAVLSDEGGIFEIMAGLYNDGRVNLDIFLQAHAGRAVRVDRQGRTAHLDAPALCFGLAVQPAVLADMGTGGKRRFRGNGTLARFLYAIPKSNIGSRDVRAAHRIPSTVSARYRSGLFDLLKITPQQIDGREVPQRLTLTPDALDCWHAFAEMIEQRQGPDGDLECISDWSGKLPGAALRIAGNFHLVEYGANPPAQIGEAIMERSLDLCTLLIDHAKAAFSIMETDPAAADAKAIFNWITAGNLAHFNRRTLWAKFKGRFTSRPDRLDKALLELERRAIVTASIEQTGGKPATIYAVNPALWRES